jgi:hypothetical protein
METYPIKLKASADFIMHLYCCETGRYEDRESGELEQEVVYCDFGDRWKTQIEIRNDAELDECWWALSSGTIGCVGFGRTANRILDQLRPLAKQRIPETVALSPRQMEKKGGGW